MSYTTNDAITGPMPIRVAWLNWPARSRWIMTFAFWALVNVLLFAPAGNFPKVRLFPAFQDKIGHLALFGTLALLVRWSIPNRWGKGWRGVVVILVLAVYGAGTECIQPGIPNAARTFEWADIMMDCIGVVAGMWMCGRLARSKDNGYFGK